MPDTLFSLTGQEFIDMYSAKIQYQGLHDDAEMQKLAWQTSLLMTATGNYGKKGIEPKKLYVSRFDEDGNLIEKPQGNNSGTPIDRELKEKQINELLAKFNK